MNLRFISLLFLVVIMTAGISVQAKCLIPELSSLPNIQTCASLDIAYGWLHDQKKDKWQTSQNEIKNIDKYANLYIISFINENGLYVAFVKKTKMKSGYKVNSYIIDYSVYEKVLSYLNEDALLEIPLVKTFQSEISKDEDLTAENLGLNNLSSLSSNAKNAFCIQYKLGSDSTAKFIFYIDQVPIGFEPNKETVKDTSLFDRLGTASLYNTFFYKTTTDYFLNFITSPFNY